MDSNSYFFTLCENLAVPTAAFLIFMLPSCQQSLLQCHSCAAPPVLTHWKLKSALTKDCTPNQAAVTGHAWSCSYQGVLNLSRELEERLGKNINFKLNDRLNTIVQPTLLLELSFSLFYHCRKFLVTYLSYT